MADSLPSQGLAPDNGIRAVLLGGPVSAPSSATPRSDRSTVITGVDLVLSLQLRAIHSREDLDLDGDPWCLQPPDPPWPDPDLDLDLDLHLNLRFSGKMKAAAVQVSASAVPLPILPFVFKTSLSTTFIAYTDGNGNASSRSLQRSAVNSSQSSTSNGSCDRCSSLSRLPSGPPTPPVIGEPMTLDDIELPSSRARLLFGIDEIYLRSLLRPWRGDDDGLLTIFNFIPLRQLHSTIDLDPPWWEVQLKKLTLQWRDLDLHPRNPEADIIELLVPSVLDAVLPFTTARATSSHNESPGTASLLPSSALQSVSPLHLQFDHCPFNQPRQPRSELQHTYTILRRCSSNSLSETSLFDRPIAIKLLRDAFSKFGSSDNQSPTKCLTKVPRKKKLGQPPFPPALGRQVGAPSVCEQTSHGPAGATSDVIVPSADPSTEPSSATTARSTRPSTSTTASPLASSPPVLCHHQSSPSSTAGSPPPPSPSPTCSAAMASSMAAARSFLLQAQHRCLRSRSRSGAPTTPSAPAVFLASPTPSWLPPSSSNRRHLLPNQPTISASILATPSEARCRPPPLRQQRHHSSPTSPTSYSIKCLTLMPLRCEFAMDATSSPAPQSPSVGALHHSQLLQQLLRALPLHFSAPADDLSIISSLPLRRRTVHGASLVLATTQRAFPGVPFPRRALLSTAYQQIQGLEAVLNSFPFPFNTSDSDGHSPPPPFYLRALQQSLHHRARVDSDQHHHRPRGQIEEIAPPPATCSTQGQGESPSSASSSSLQPSPPSSSSAGVSTLSAKFSFPSTTAATVLRCC